MAEQNSQSLLYIEDSLMKYEYLTHDSIYTTDFFEFYKLESNTYIIPDVFDLFVDYSYTLDSSAMINELRLNDSILLNIKFPKLDCNYLVSLHSASIKDKLYYSFNNIDSISIPLTYTLDSDIDIDRVNESGIWKEILSIGNVVVYFIWSPEQLLKNHYLPEKVWVGLYSYHYTIPPNGPDTTFSHISSINISLQKLNQYLVNIPCFRSHFFKVSPGKINFGDLEFKKTKNIDKLLKQRR